MGANLTRLSALHFESHCSHQIEVTLTAAEVVHMACMYAYTQTAEDVHIRGGPILTDLAKIGSCCSLEGNIGLARARFFWAEGFQKLLQDRENRRHVTLAG